MSSIKAPEPPFGRVDCGPATTPFTSYSRGGGSRGGPPRLSWAHRPQRDLMRGTSGVNVSRHRVRGSGRGTLATIMHTRSKTTM